MRSPTRILLLLLTLVAAGPAASARADSIFGLSFFGSPLPAGDARIGGRAGMGLAYRDSLNPAVLQATQLPDLARVTVGVTNLFERRGSEDEFGSLTRWGLVTPSIRAGFPLLGRAGIGVGFSARRATQWTLERPYEEGSDDLEIIEREGTQFDVPLLLGVRLHEKLVVGTGLHLERGTVRMRYLIDLAAAGETDPLETREDVYDGITPEVSVAVYDLGPVSLAGHWIAGFDADVKVSQRGVALSNREDSERTDSMPARWGLGTRVALGDVWSVGADYTVQEWSQYEGRSFTYDENGVFDPDGTASPLQDETAWRVGLERESVRVGLRYTTPLRVGAYSRRWHYQLAGNDLTEWGVTVGTGITLRAGWARTDFAIGYSQIGDTGENGVTESVLRFSLSVTGGERWY